MVEQYPDIIVVSWKTPAIKDEETGNYTPGNEVTHTFNCRAEVNSKSRKVIGDDGVLIDYAYDVYMPKTDVEIPDFIADYILNGSVEGKVKRAKNNQLNSRLWL